MKSTRSLVAVAVFALALAGCGGGSGGGTNVTVEAQDSLKYSPATIEAAAGQPLNVTLKNTGALEHTLIIDELGLTIGPVAGQQSGSGSVTAAAGTYTFYCNIPGHKEAGMTGTLTVK